MTSRSSIEGYTTKEIKGIYGISDAAVRMAIKRNTLIEGMDCIKIGTTWLIKVESAEALWGDKINKN